MSEDERKSRDGANKAWALEEHMLSLNDREVIVDLADLPDRAQLLEFHERLQAEIRAMPVGTDERILDTARRQLRLYRSLLFIPVQTDAAPESASEPADQPQTSASPRPPRIGETLVGLFCSRDMREAVLGDLDEKFVELAERRGVKVAKAWYWGQAGRSALFFAVRWGRRLLELEAILKRIL